MKYSNSNRPIQCMLTNSTCYKGTTPMEVKGVLWHSTGANNPTLKRYVQPSTDDPNYSYLIDKIGKNQYNNDFNHIYVKAGLNAFIGEFADGSVGTVQTMPWNWKPWGCGSGAKGSCNNGWIQFEIAEDSLNDPNYFAQVYKEACELTAYLCKMFNINPHGTVYYNGVNVPTILCHKDSCTLGLGSNHADVLHWFPKFGKTMDDVRNDVANLMNGTNEDITFDDEDDDDDMTQEKFNEMCDNYWKMKAAEAPSSWSQKEREWCEKVGLIQGGDGGNKMYKKYLNREEMAALLYRFHEKGL